VTNISVTETGCTEARSVINRGPAGRANSGWSCPVTGNRFYTSCSKGSQHVAWSVPGGDSP